MAEVRLPGQLVSSMSISLLSVIPPSALFPSLFSTDEKPET